MGPSIRTIQWWCLHICSIEFGSRDLMWVEEQPSKWLHVSCGMGSVLAPLIDSSDRIHLISCWLLGSVNVFSRNSNDTPTHLIRSWTFNSKGPIWTESLLIKETLPIALKSRFLFTIYLVISWYNLHQHCYYPCIWPKFVFLVFNVGHLWNVANTTIKVTLS
jgi:hypothetical protein